MEAHWTLEDHIAAGRPTRLRTIEITISWHEPNAAPPTVQLLGVAAPVPVGAPPATAPAAPPAPPPPQATQAPAPAAQPAAPGAVAAAATHPTPGTHPLALTPAEQAALPDRVPVFPYGDFMNVPIAAIWPARLADGDHPEDTYVITEAKLREAEGRVSERKQQLETEKTSGWEAKVRYAEQVLNDIADELARRADEAGGQQAPGGAA